MPCIRCGQPTAGTTLCDNCAAEINKAEEKRRKRVSMVFTLLVAIAILIYLKITGTL